MAQCYCGRSFTETFDEKGLSLGLCPACIAASNGGGYMASKEWTCGHVVDDSSEYVRESEE